MENELKLGPEFIWKNFHLGSELEIAGNFIYDGLYNFDKMKHFYYETDIFSCLYHLSVGIERIQKITLILLTNFDDQVNIDFEKSLMSHSTQRFHDLINSKLKKKIRLNKNQNKFLTLLSNFYDKNRYGRFNFKSSASSSHEKELFVNFLNDLVVEEEICADFTNSTSNNDNLKTSFGSNLKGIIIPYYKIIESICRQNNFYTYEMNQDSKAFQILVCENFNFLHVNHLKLEIIYFFLNNGNELLKNNKMVATDFDPDTILELIKFLTNQCENTYIIDTYKCIIADQISNSESLIDTILNRKLYLNMLFGN